MVLVGTGGSSKCVPCAVGCLTCSASDISSCIGCAKGFFSVPDNKGINRCLSCFKNCSECSSESTCTTCATGYVLSPEQNKCTLRCSESCATCEDNLPSKCLSCWGDAVFNANSSRCDSSLACNATSSCTVCPSNHVLNDKKQCLKCNVTTLNCNACTYDDLTTCARCVNGFYLLNKLCVKCDLPCLTCGGKGACLTCTGGNYLVAGQGSLSGLCRKCDTSCLTCDKTPNQCTSCTNTSRLVGFNCISQNNVTVETKLDLTMAEFVNFVEDFRSWLATESNKAIGSSANFNKNMVNLLNVTEGSVNINSALSVGNASLVETIANAITQALSNGAKIGSGIPISGKAVANVIQGSGSTKTTTEESSSKLGLILGLSIPLGLLFIVAVIVILYKICQRKNDD